MPQASYFTVMMADEVGGGVLKPQQSRRQQTRPRQRLPQRVVSKTLRATDDRRKSFGKGKDEKVLKGLNKDAESNPVSSFEQMFFVF